MSAEKLLNDLYNSFIVPAVGIIRQ